MKFRALVAYSLATQLIFPVFGAYADPPDFNHQVQISPNKVSAPISGTPFTPVNGVTPCSHVGDIGWDATPTVWICTALPNTWISLTNIVGGVLTLSANLSTTGTGAKTLALGNTVGATIDLSGLQNLIGLDTTFANATATAAAAGNLSVARAQCPMVISDIIATGTLTTPTCGGKLPAYGKLQECGGGGGGGGGGGAGATAGGVGGTTVFTLPGAVTMTASGGLGGTLSGAGVAGGAATGGLPAGFLSVAGSFSGAGFPSISASFGGLGGMGGNGWFGSGGSVSNGSNGNAVAPNTCGGGGGGAATSAASNNSGNGGGSGGLIEGVISGTNITASYAVTINAVGTAGTTGASGTAGVAGSLGRVRVAWEW